MPHWFNRWEYLFIGVLFALGVLSFASGDITGYGIANGISTSFLIIVDIIRVVLDFTIGLVQALMTLGAVGVIVLALVALAFFGTGKLIETVAFAVVLLIVAGIVA